jgi:proteasome beta subunit
MTEGVIPPLVGASAPMGANPSFFDLVARSAPESLPRAHTGDVVVPHGTTVLGVKFGGGVLIAGDRRATEGYAIADDRMQKVFAADEYSAIAIAGAAGQAVEIVKLFQLELEHYEKITGARLSLEGKANRLGQMIRGNFPLAMQGLIVVPLFGGFDETRDEGRLFYYDATGGRWEEEDFHATGSGGRPAKSSLKKLWRPGLSRDDGLRVAVEALIDAAEEDAATGGPDPSRGIFPTVQVIDADGSTQATDEQVRIAYDAVIAARDEGLGGSTTGAAS